MASGIQIDDPLQARVQQLEQQLENLQQQVAERTSSIERSTAQELEAKVHLLCCPVVVQVFAL